MKESVRRIVMLCTILTFGLVLIFFDVTLIQLFFMMIVLVIILPFILGIATVDEVRSGLANMKKTGILKRLDEMKFFEKSHSPKDKKTPVKAEKSPQKPAAAEKKKPSDKAGGIVTHLKSIASSFGSLGSVLKERGKRGKKVEDINKMLDKAVSEKLPASPPHSSTAAATAGSSLPAPGGAGGMPAVGDDSDPFLSLSGDEFDAGLLDGLDDDSPPEMPGEIIPDSPTGGSAPDLPAPELSLPSMDASGDAVGGGLDEFSGLEGSGGLDAEFGDLDNLSLDDVEIDEDMDGPAASTEASAEASSSGSSAATPAAAPKEDSGVVKTAWIASDAPAGADAGEDQIGIQSDMASFASADHGTDEDLLSSIASDVKTVKKEKDLSLLRELKDFKAPATDIEDELKGMYQQISSSAKKKDGEQSAPDGMK